MMIKDLEMSKDLDRDALSAVRGGNSISRVACTPPSRMLPAASASAARRLSSAPPSTRLRRS